jgi:hypothetical protein
MSQFEFQPFHPGLDPEVTLMVDGYEDGYRTISHWPGHSTPEPLRHDLTTGSALMLAEMSAPRRRELLGDFSIVTNNHYDVDGALSLFSLLQPDVALKHKDLILRTAATGDLAKWSGADALALELTLMTDLEQFVPYSSSPMNEESLNNLRRVYQRTFDRLEETLLENPFAIQNGWEKRHKYVVDDIERIDAGEGIDVTRYPADDLAVIVTDRRTTLIGLRYAAGDLYRVLLAYPGEGGTRYRFCYRAESWFDVTSINPKPRVPLTDLTNRLNELEQNTQHQWWSAPIDWVVPELGFGEPTAFDLQAVRFDPSFHRDPMSSLSVETVVEELRRGLA